MRTHAATLIKIAAKMSVSREERIALVNVSVRSPSGGGAADDAEVSVASKQKTQTLVGYQEERA